MLEAHDTLTHMLEAYGTDSGSIWHGMVIYRFDLEDINVDYYQGIT